ncbi:MAG: SCO family protein [Verrucomicrobiota bacterium]
MKALLCLCGLLLLINAKAAAELSREATEVQVFSARGLLMELQPDSRTLIIRHEAITNYMAAMTMPFKVKTTNEFANLKAGDTIAFRLQVTATESWVDGITRTGAAAAEQKPPAIPAPKKISNHPLRNFPFTNELGQAVRLNDFCGQALAITFIFTRCPLPEFCPRLSKNFSEAAHKLRSLTNAPTNWHFLSVTFDPEFDSPAMLKAYGEGYQYDAAHWSFLTGPTNEIRELARQSGVQMADEGGTINHNFRTLIIDAAGHLQMTFPTSGDLSDAIVSEMLKAAAATN